MKASSRLRTLHFFSTRYASVYYTTCGGLGFSPKGVGFVPDVDMAPPKILQRASRAITPDTPF